LSSSNNRHSHNPHNNNSSNNRLPLHKISSQGIISEVALILHSFSNSTRTTHLIINSSSMVSQVDHHRTSFSLHRQGLEDLGVRTAFLDSREQSQAMVGLRRATVWT